MAPTARGHWVTHVRLNLLSLGEPPGEGRVLSTPAAAALISVFYLSEPRFPVQEAGIANLSALNKATCTQGLTHG